MDDNIEPGKLFVGGLSWETTQQSMKEYFSKFGEIEECVIMRDPTTGNPRGFGFVQFKDPQSVDNTLKLGSHVLDKKTIDPKQATAKGHTPSTNITNVGEQAEHVSKKVFIGGVPTQATEEQIKAVFSQFGNVTEVNLKKDKQTQRMRGFGFVSFDDSFSVIEAVKQHYVVICDKQVEIKTAEPRYSNGQYSGPSAQGGFGSYGGGAAAAGGMGVPQMQQYSGGGGWNNSGRNFQFQYYPQTAQQHQYGGATSGQYTVYGHNTEQYAGGYGAAAAAATVAQRYSYPYTTAAQQQHSYPQDTNSYGAPNPNSYGTSDAYSSATGYSYTDQTNSYHHPYDQSAAAGVASTTGYPRTAQTQQRVTAAAAAYSNFGGAR